MRQLDSGNANGGIVDRLETGHRRIVLCIVTPTKPVHDRPRELENAQGPDAKAAAQVARVFIS
jgi:hypothetical protein